MNSREPSCTDRLPRPTMDSDDNDSSIFALLAASSEDGDNSTTHRELPPLHVWAEHVLVDAWSAAMNEFKASESAHKGRWSVLNMFCISRPTQLPLPRLILLIESNSFLLHRCEWERNCRECIGAEDFCCPPRWYTPPCPSKPSSSSSSSRPAKRPHSSVVHQEDEEEEEALDDEEGYAVANIDEQEQVIEYAEEIEVEEVLLPTPSPAIQPLPPRYNVNVHPSRLDHVQHNDPYFNAAEWKPVSSSSKTKSNKKVIVALPGPSEPPSPGLVIPEPPTVEQAIPQEQALLDSQTSQQALEKALQAWYTAGYAAALYHVRSGAVKP